MSVLCPKCCCCKIIILPWVSGLSSFNWGSLLKIELFQLDGFVPGASRNVVAICSQNYISFV